jgi:hypothetical protein
VGVSLGLLWPSHQFRQLGDVRRDAPGFVHLEPLRRVGAGACLPRVDVGERLAGCVLDDIAAGDAVNAPRRWEAAAHTPNTAQSTRLISFAGPKLLRCVLHDPNDTLLVLLAATVRKGGAHGYP